MIQSNQPDSALLRPLQSQNGVFSLFIIESEKIGFGRQGVCYLGFYPPENKIVLLKKQFCLSQSFHLFQKKYRRQVDNLSRASNVNMRKQHSNIVNVYPAYILSKHHTHAYIMMQYCRGGSLKELINYRRRQKGYWFSFGQFCTMFRDLINGLGQLNDCNILHQDLKPQNIFISEGYLKIGDFGFSYNLNSIRIRNGGTPKYNAPQKYVESYTPAFSSDIYAMGVIIYMLIFYRHPYYTSEELKSYEKNYLANNQINVQGIAKRQVYEQINTERIKQQLFYNFLITRKLSNNHTYQIKVNSKQRSCLQKIIDLVKRMVSFKIQQRPSYQKIKMQMQQLPLQFQNLQFVEKAVPIRYKKAIQLLSEIQMEKLPQIKYHTYYRGSQIFEQISNLSTQIQRVNMMTNLIFSITEGLQKEVNQKRAYLPCLKNLVPALKAFNYCITYNKYIEFLQQVTKMQSQEQKMFYQSGQSYLLSNTEHNKNFLQSQTFSYLNLRDIKIQQAYIEMKRFTQEYLININSNQVEQRKQIMVDKQNKFAFLLVILVLQTLKYGQNISKQQILEVKSNEKNYISNKDKISVLQIDNMLRRYGIGTGVLQICDD